MTLIWREDEVSIEVLSKHAGESGFNILEVENHRIRLRTESGIGYSIALLPEQRFVQLSTYLPLRNDESRSNKLALEHRLNGFIFLPTFSLDTDEDLTVSYVLPYQHGLIAGQFAAIVRRFGSMLDYVVRAQNEEGLIDFGERRNYRSTALPN